MHLCQAAVSGERVVPTLMIMLHSTSSS
jgi:hypothetical protein